MGNLNNIQDIFLIFHDGIICSWSGDNHSLTLKINCEYLAQRIDKSYKDFFIDFLGINELEFKTWPNPFDLPVKTLKVPQDIFKAKLEILSADISDNCVIIDCNQHDTNFDYCGGKLSINCNSIKIFDQNKNELTIEIMDKICNEYWTEKSNELEADIIKKQQGK